MTRPPVMRVRRGAPEKRVQVAWRRTPAAPGFPVGVIQGDLFAEVA